MRDIMDQLLKNQKYLFIAIFGGLIIIFLGWYFLIQKSLSKEHNRSSNAKIVLSNDVNKFKNMESQISNLEVEWNDINSQFEMVIDKIPDKRLFDSVTDFLYSMIVNQGLKIQNFSPSKAAIEKKTILVHETGDEITIEKVPIDITLKGSFINFGQLLESMKNGRYRLTASNIEILQKQKTSAQTIKLISYAYFQSKSNRPLVQTTKAPNIKRKNAQTIMPVSKTNNTVKKVEPTKIVDNNVKSIDSLEGVPEMWLEPATEPVEETTVAKRSNPDTKPVLKKEESAKTTEVKLPPVKIKEAEQNTVASEPKSYVEKLVIIQAMACKKVKNNQPLYPGRRFPTDIGRVYCHTLLDNNSEKHSDIYHIWYMNGNLKAKVRIRV